MERSGLVDPRARLRRLFEAAFRVADIAESLLSVDAALPAAEACALLDERRFTLAGVRRRGFVAGYLRRADLDGHAGECGACARPFDPDDVVPFDAPLSVLIEALAERPRLFVSAFGRVDGIVTRNDLKKPPVRMWLFGMVTMLEEAFGRLVDVRHPDGAWQALLSPARLAKAKALFEERLRRDPEDVCTLLDCLQLVDKGRILIKDPEVRAAFKLESKAHGDRVVGNIEQFRNRLAHAQDVIAGGFEQVVNLARGLDLVFDIAAHAREGALPPPPPGAGADT